MKRNLAVSYDFPPGQFGGNDEPAVAVTPEALIGFEEDWGQWVRFFATSHGEYFSIRMKKTGNGWAYRYVSFFGSKPETAAADATFTKKSDTEYSIDDPTYPENGKQVTERHRTIAATNYDLLEDGSGDFLSATIAN